MSALPSAISIIHRNKRATSLALDSALNSRHASLENRNSPAAVEALVEMSFRTACESPSPNTLQSSADQPKKQASFR
jgi:hypothetical protein